MSTWKKLRVILWTVLAAVVIGGCTGGPYKGKYAGGSTYSDCLQTGSSFPRCAAYYGSSTGFEGWKQ